MNNVANEQLEQTTEQVQLEENEKTSNASIYLDNVVNNQSLSAPIERVSLSQEKKAKSKFRLYAYCGIKRTFDFFSALIALIVLSPFILLFLFIKWVEDGHNPIYVSTRIGKNGKPFRFYKIRTMCANAELMKDDLIKKGLNETDGPAFKMKEDPRITKVGKIYRKLSIDELLQLLNIIKGDMSVVGPRPPLPREVEEYTEDQIKKLSVKGGLLCLWQITKNRNSLSFEEWVKLDIEYIEKRSVWLDLKIIFKGLYMVIFDRTGE